MIWLWFTVLFANFAEAVAEGRGKAQADTLRKARTETARQVHFSLLSSYKKFETVSADKLRAGDLVVCEAGDVIPGWCRDAMIAWSTEAAITGSPRPSSAVSGGTVRQSRAGPNGSFPTGLLFGSQLLPGSSFLDRIIKLVYGPSARRRRMKSHSSTPLVGSTIIFVFADGHAWPSSYVTYAGGVISADRPVVLLRYTDPDHHSCLAVGHRYRRRGSSRAISVSSHPGHAVEAAGDVDKCRRLDKTGTVTFGNRQATELIVVPGATEREARRGSFAGE